MTRANAGWSRLALVAVLLVAALLIACSGNDSKKPQDSATPAETASPSATPLPCPVDQAICDFAATVEPLVQARDYKKIAESSPGLEPGTKQQAEQAIPTGTPKLVSIGCPFGAVSESCVGYFSLVFTTFQPKGDWTGHGGIFILMYERRAAPLGPGLRMVNRVEEFEMRRASLAGGLAQGPCNFSGWSDDQGEQGCSRSWFHPYSTDGTVFAPVDDKPGETFQVLAPAPPPKNTAMFIATGCWACEGYDSGIQLVVTEANGNTTTEKLPEPPVQPGESRTELAMSPDGSLLLAGTCRASNCGPLGPTPADIQSRILASYDAGRSWAEVASGPGFLSFQIGPSNRILVTRYYGPGSPDGWTNSWELVGSSQPVVRPANANAEARPFFLPDGSIGWTYYQALEVLRSDGSVYFSMAGKVTAADRVDGFSFGPDGRTYVRWASGQAPAGGALKSYLSAFNPAGVGIWRRELGGREFYLGRFISSRLSLGNIQDLTPRAIGMLPALVDLDVGTIQPFGTTFGVAPFTGRNSFLAMVQGPFARVAAGGDCLNIRESASISAKALTCARDGSLLRDLGESTTAGGISWLKVRTLGGDDGWASTEFLK
jgi:hypothetical protein